MLWDFVIDRWWNVFAYAKLNVFTYDNMYEIGIVLTTIVALWLQWADDEDELFLYELPFSPRYERILRFVVPHFRMKEPDEMCLYICFVITFAYYYTIDPTMYTGDFDDDLEAFLKDKTYLIRAKPLTAKQVPFYNKLRKLKKMYAFPVRHSYHYAALRDNEIHYGRVWEQEVLYTYCQNARIKWGYQVFETPGFKIVTNAHMVRMPDPQYELIYPIWGKPDAWWYSLNSLRFPWNGVIMEYRWFPFWSLASVSQTSVRLPMEPNTMCMKWTFRDKYMIANYVKAYHELSLVPVSWMYGAPGHKLYNTEGQIARVFRSPDYCGINSEFSEWLDQKTLDPKKELSNFEVIWRGPVMHRLMHYVRYHK